MPGYRTPQRKRKAGRKLFSSRTKARRVMAPRGMGKGFISVATPRTFGFPNTVSAVLRYHDRSQLNPNVFDTQVRVFRLNSVFDPDAAVGGHQPRGVDEYATIYNHYRVKTCRWKINVMTDQGVPTLVGWAIRRSSTANAYTDYIEQGDSKWVNLGSSTGKDHNTVSGSVDIAKWLSLDQSNSRLESPFTGDPDETLFLHVWATGDGIAQPGAITFDTVLDYTTLMREKKVLAQST